MSELVFIVATHHSLLLTVQLWIIAIIVIVLAICAGICAGFLCGVCCQLLYEKIRQRKPVLESTYLFIITIVCRKMCDHVAGTFTVYCFWIWTRFTSFILLLWQEKEM